MNRFEWAGDDFSNTLVLALGIIGLMLISFAREKQEDEFISLIRLKSWQWAVAISYGILFLANLLIYGTDFFGFMVYNMFTVLVVFVIVFYWNMFKLRREGAKDEK